MRVSDTAMSKFKARILAASGLVILVLTISFLSRGHTTAQAPRDCPGVSICNTDAQPVPVRGAVQITNVDAQPIPVNQTGVARVEVTNVDSQPLPVSGGVDVKSPVSVKTSPREPIHVAFAPLPENLFYAEGTVGLRPGDFSVLHSPPGFEVPAGKILALKQVSADIEMGNPSQVPHVFLKRAQPVPATFPLFEVRQGATEWGISQSLGLPGFMPGTTIEILFQRSGGSAGQATLTLALTGELHDAP